jgi:Uma2 family endonuclease
MSSTRVERPTRLSRLSNGRLMTPDEFDAVTVYDDRYRYELVHGVLVVTPIPGAGESDPNEELGRFLRNYQADHPQGSVLDMTLAEQYVYLADSRRRADRLIWTGLGRVPVREKDVPTIAVEFVSNRTRDRKRDYEEKRHDYLSLGIQEYWVIDRFKRTLSVFRRPPAQPAEEVLEATAVYQTPLLPGFELPLARLLTLADRWKERGARG